MIPLVFGVRHANTVAKRSEAMVGMSVCMAIDPMNMLLIILKADSIAKVIHFRKS